MILKPLVWHPHDVSVSLIQYVISAKLVTPLPCVWRINMTGLRQEIETRKEIKPEKRSGRKSE